MPPYLTMPLMDEILIPFQNGQAIDTQHVMLLLGGLLAVGPGWPGGWAGPRTYVLALVSERIGADLRTATFEHLLRLSLDYFGSKRTGDLMARIGSETDRINVFLSLHALDFATDVLMIAMTAAILYLHQPLAGPGHPGAAALHRLADPHRCATACAPASRRSTASGPRSPTCWPTPSPASAWSRPLPRKSARPSRFRAANQHNLQVNDKLNKTWIAVHAHRLAADRDRACWWSGASASGWCRSSQITVGVLTAFIAYIGRFYTPARFDEPHRLGHAKGGRRCQAHLRHPGPCQQRARPGPTR